jgi:transcriptional antiterminator RfaH
VDSAASIEKDWYAVYTRPKEEQRAELNLASWGVEVLAPKILERRTNEFSGRPSYFVKPLFPRYIFARFDAERLLRKVHYTRGVHSIVSLDGQPVKVEESVIEIIKSRIKEDGFVKIGEDLNVSDKVVVKSGALKNFVGVFERRIKATDRIMILLTAITYQGRISIQEQMVEKIA